MTAYIEQRREPFGVEPICRVLGVPVSTHYARRSRKPSRRALRDRELLKEIEAARIGYRCVYGARKTWLELRRRGVETGRDQVARVMCEHGIEGKLRGRRRRTTIPDEAAVSRTTGRAPFPRVRARSELAGTPGGRRNVARRQAESRVRFERVELLRITLIGVCLAGGRGGSSPPRPF